MGSIDPNLILLIGALLLAAGIVLGGLSSRFGVPFLLVFLVVGMLAGEDGPGGIAFNDFGVALLVGNLALGVILFDGGLRTQYRTFRVALAPSLALATLGVALTAGLVAAAAKLLFGFGWPVALLLGAIVASTDAAAVFSLLKGSGVRLNDRVASTLEIESGVNDPMAVFLTLMLIEWVMRPADLTGWSLATALVKQFGLGAAMGLVLGFALAGLLARMRKLGGNFEGLQAILATAGGVSLFALTNLWGGSGFLAVYLAGLVVGNWKGGMSEDAMRALDGLAWLAQSGMFLMLGLLVTPREVWPLLVPAMALAGVLMLVARPLGVWLTLLPFRFPLREVGFMSWMGLRGAVPIVLAIFPLMAGVPEARTLFNIAFVLVLASLLVQGASVRVAARLTAVGLPPLPEPARQARWGRASHMMEFRLAEGMPPVGTTAQDYDWPRGVQALAVRRVEPQLAGGSELRWIDAQEAGPLRVGDAIVLLVANEALEAAAHCFDPAAPAPAVAAAAAVPTMQAVFGDFVLDGDVALVDVLALYGLPLPDALPDSALKERASLDAVIRSCVPRAVEGDVLKLGDITLTVREMRNGRVLRVGFKLPGR